MRTWRTTFRRWAGAALVAATAFGAAGTARAEDYKDEQLGYSLSFPKKWQKRPIGADERWIVAKFESKREFEDADPKTNFWTSHRPWLDVVVIPLSLQEEKGGTVEKDPETGKVLIRQQAPWKDLKGYLEKNLVQTEGGFYFSKEEEAQVGGMRCMQYEVTFDKLVRSPRRVYAWAYYTDDAIYGLVGEALIKWEGDLKPDILAAFKSFKAFARKGALPGAERTGSDVVIGADPRDENLDDDAKKRKREQKVAERLARVLKSVGPDWTEKHSEHFIAVSHSDPKHTKSVLDHCETLRAWLDDNLGYVGNGYAGKMILRICKDRDEADALRQTGGWSSFLSYEAVTYKDKEGFSDWGPIDSLNREVFHVWLRDKNPFSWAIPNWIDMGLAATVATAESKGRKIEFRPSTWDKVTVAQMRRDGKLRTARQFFSMTTEELWGEGWDASTQRDSFARFLIVGGARKSAKFKNVFSDYMKAIVLELDEREAKRRKEEKAAGKEQADEGPKDEKEEEEQIRRRQESWRAEEKDFLDKVFKRAFPSWTDKDWDALQAAYVKELE